MLNPLRLNVLANLRARLGQLWPVTSRGHMRCNASSWCTPLLCGFSRETLPACLLHAAPRHHESLNIDQHWLQPPLLCDPSGRQSSRHLIARMTDTDHFMFPSKLGNPFPNCLRMETLLFSFGINCSSSSGLFFERLSASLRLVESIELHGKKPTSRADYFRSL